MKKSRQSKQQPSRNRSPKTPASKSVKPISHANFASRYTIKNLQMIFWGKIRYFVESWQAWIAIAGFVLTALVLYPRVVVTPGSNVLSHNPLTAPFTITNSSIITLEDVKVGFALCILSPKPLSPNTHCDYRHMSRVLVAKWARKSLSMDATDQVVIDDVFAYPREGVDVGADIALFIDFHPSFLPFTMEKIYRFHTVPNADGTSRWEPADLEEG